MDIDINPFQQLYFSDDVQSEDNYVDLFSDKVLQTAINPVFQGGNVVLSGTQGCGKTMILSLLRPQTRIAYWEKGEKFPVNKTMRNFVSAGINLTRSRITDIAQVSLNRGDEVDAREMPFYFADFLNYLVVEDLLNSIEVIGQRPEVFDSLVDVSKYQEFVAMLTTQDCWFGALDEVRDATQLRPALNQRIQFYRRWVNGNIESDLPPENIRKTKTNIGEPIAKAAECLRQCGVIANDVPVLIRIDQIEELHRAFTSRQRIILLAFRKMINRAFSARDARVNYRAGTRRYGWKDPEYQSIWGSEARLEERRDYLFVDMDEQLFARGENKNTIFEKFAEDTFLRRVKYYFGEEGKKLKLGLAKSVFGKHPIAEKRLAQLNLNPTKEQIDRALALNAAADDGKWSEEWREFLHNLYRKGHEGMLDAILASAWGRQTGGGNRKRQHRESPPPENAPWQNRKWWRKERLDQAVLQLSTRCQQRFMWWGFSDIISLSGGNITVFLHLCHRIWDAFLKNQSSKPESERIDLLRGGEIERNIQSAGILSASNDWFNKLPEEPAGNSRQNFVEKFGVYLNSAMMDDLRMSYPGGNGISITLAEYNSDEKETSLLRGFIDEMVDYGVLFSTEHSSKSKSGGKRIKFYLHPILCPRYQLPEARTKEPYYWKIQNLFELISKAKVTLPRSERKKNLKDDYQHSLNFDGE